MHLSFPVFHFFYPWSPPVFGYHFLLPLLSFYSPLLLFTVLWNIFSHSTLCYCHSPLLSLHHLCLSLSYTILALPSISTSFPLLSFSFFSLFLDKKQQVKVKDVNSNTTRYAKKTLSTLRFFYFYLKHFGVFLFFYLLFFFTVAAIVEVQLNVFVLLFLHQLPFDAL